MAKPVNRKTWLFNCPECGNNKLRYVAYKDTEKYTCVKCNHKWERSKRYV